MRARPRRGFSSLATYVFRGRERAMRTLQAWAVYLGTPRLVDSVPKVHIRSTWCKRVKGGRLVAWCSVTGQVRFQGPWAEPENDWLRGEVLEGIPHDRTHATPA